MGIEKITYPVKDDFFKLEVWNNNIKAIVEQFATDENRLTAVEKKAGTNTTNIGTLSNLNTTTKTSLVGAVNEVNTSVKTTNGKITTNLLKPTLATTTIGGITCTNNGDGTYTLNGTSEFQVILGFKQDENYSDFNNKELKCVGCPEGGDNTTFMIAVHDSDGYSWDYGKGVKFKCSNVLWIAIVIREKQTISNLVFKPMITTNLNATYDDFVPYTGETGQINSDLADVVKNMGSGDGVIASKLQTARNIALTGTVKGNVNFDGSGDVSITTTMQNGTVMGNVDWNTLITEGTYKVQGSTMSSKFNTPNGDNEEFGYGALFVLNTKNGNEFRIVQIYMPIQSYKYPLWIRSGNKNTNSTNWFSWVGLKNYDSMIGTLSNLSTTTKTNLVSAINEVSKKVTNIGTQVSDLQFSVTDGILNVTYDDGN